MYPEEFDELFISNSKQFNALSSSTQVAYCIHRLEAEVNNGGFYQYFDNSTGEYVQQTLNSLSLIGAEKTKILIENAISISYRNGYPDDPKRHSLDLRDYDEVFDQLYAVDHKFYMYEDPLEDLVNNYLSINPIMSQQNKFEKKNANWFRRIFSL